MKQRVKSDKHSGFQLALAQMLVLPGEAELNLQRAVQSIREAATAGAEMVLLPEALPSGWTDESGRAQASEIPNGWFCLKLREAARKHSIFVCSGLAERRDGSVFNSAVLIDSQGEVLLVHRKLYELEIAHGCYELGDRLGVAETPWGRMGLMICADAFAPGEVISRTLGLMGAQVILSPSAWAVPPEHDNLKEPYGKLWMDHYGPVARDFGLWIAGCSNVGPIRSGAWVSHKCIGCSLVVGPDGAARIRGTYGKEEMLFVAITPETPKARGTGWEAEWRK